MPSIEQPNNYMMTNVQGTVNVLEAARKAKVKKNLFMLPLHLVMEKQKILSLKIQRFH